jgi:hypothetical protein
MARPFLTSVGSEADSPEPLLGRHLPLTMMPKSLKYQTRISAMMLNIFQISRPNGG